MFLSQLCRGAHLHPCHFMLNCALSLYAQGLRCPWPFLVARRASLVEHIKDSAHRSRPHLLCKPSTLDPPSQLCSKTMLLAGLLTAKALDVWKPQIWCVGSLERQAKRTGLTTQSADTGACGSFCRTPEPQKLRSELTSCPVSGSREIRRAWSKLLLLHLAWPESLGTWCRGSTPNGSHAIQTARERVTTLCSHC